MSPLSIAVHNEERVLAAALDNYVRQDVGFYIVDNDSTDLTVSIAERYRGRGLVGIERFPRDGIYEWKHILKRKEELAVSLDADWFIHADADEIRPPPSSGDSLCAAIERADTDGFNAVNFFEFTFTPTQEAPNHEHPDFERTMRSYYPFSPAFPWRLNAWKKQTARVDLASSGGHVVRFEHQRLSPETFKMRHYLFLSKAHAIAKWVERRFSAAEIEEGWHGWRPQITAESIDLPSESELRHYSCDDERDSSNPRIAHDLQNRYESWRSRGGDWSNGLK